MRISRLDHLVLRVRDAAAMIRFYVDVVGCTPDRSVGHLGLHHLRAGESMIDLVAVDGELGRAGGAPPGAEGRNLDHLCLRVDPFDEGEIRRHFEEHGVELSPVYENYGAEGTGPSIYFTDPEGNTIELKGPAR
jgi:catechol 2,3-dioxygenase-like lactoylglutathione lyase family enzyme